MHAGDMARGVQPLHVDPAPFETMAGLGQQLGEEFSLPGARCPSAGQMRCLRPHPLRWRPSVDPRPTHRCPGTDGGEGFGDVPGRRSARRVGVASAAPPTGTREGRSPRSTDPQALSPPPCCAERRSPERAGSRSSVPRGRRAPTGEVRSRQVVAAADPFA